MSEVSTFYNREAEQSLIGICLNDVKAAKKIADAPETAWYYPLHRTILQGIRALLRQGTPPDLVTVSAWLTANGKDAETGGFQYLVECTQYGFSPAMVNSYLNILHRCAMNRSLNTIGKELMARAAADNPDETREWAARAVRDVRLGDGVKLIPMQEACYTTYEKLEKQQTREGEPEGRIKSGIDSLDAILGGLRDGEYVAIGARPSVGKSILALTFCMNAAKQGKKVLLISLEMSETQITERVLANESNIPLNMITSGKISLDAWQSIANVMNPVSSLPFWYCLEATTVEKVRRAAYQLYENGGLDMIAVDYLQLMEATYAKRQNRQEQIAEISRGLRLLAQEMQIPIIVLTQLNRASEKERIDGKRVRREPTMSEARESGAIEQDANIFLLLHDPHKDEMRDDVERAIWDKVNEKGMTLMRVIIDKNRQGKRGKVTVAFDGDHMRFLPLRKEEPK